MSAAAGNIIELASEAAVNAAWNEYAALAVQLRDDPHLLVDREFNKQMARAHEKWRRLFLIQDRA